MTDLLAPGFGCLPVTLLDALLDLSLRQVTLERADIADEQLAVEVICFVRNAARLKVNHIEDHLAAIYVESPNNDALWPLDL